MDLFRCVVLTILFTETIGGDFFISDNASNWKSATTQCQLAEPDLIFATDGKVLVNISLDIDDVWVGYYQARTAFEYFGCAKKDDGEPMFKTEQEDPGQCMSACGANKKIGIFQKECFCFDNEKENDEGTMFKHCKEECNNGMVCGGIGPRQKKYISLYRSIGTDEDKYWYISAIDEVSNGGDEGHVCMYYDNSGFTWDKCDQNYKIICGLGDSGWIQLKKTQPFTGHWALATSKCFANKTRPSTYSNTLHFPTTNSTPRVWTGIVRSRMIYKYTDDLPHLEHADQYGYLRNSGDSYKLLFEDGLKKSLCLKETYSSITYPSSKSTVSSTMNDGTTASVTASTVKTENISLPSLTTEENNSTKSLFQFQNEGASHVGTIVGTTLSVVVVIVIVVVVAVFLRKRRIHLLCFMKEKQAPSPSMIQNNDAYAISRPVEILQSTNHTDNEGYAEIDLTSKIDNEARNGKLNDAPELSAYAHDCFVLEKPEEEQYDSTTAGDQKSDTNTYNPYNKLSFEESSNYDHIGAGNTQAGNVGRKVTDSENTYNTTSLGNSYLESSGGESNNAYSMAEETEDTYNHTNVPMGLKTSENDYDAI